MIGRTMVAAALAATAFGATDARAELLDEVKERGMLRCGTLNYIPGVGFLNDRGEWSGFDVDFCRAAAAAIFGDADKVEFVATTGANKFPVLESGEIDILSRSVTQTASRENELGFDFIGPNHMTGTHFMVHKDLGVTKAEELDGATVCVLSGTTTEEQLADWFRAQGMSFQPVAAEDSDQMFAMYFEDRCDAVTMEPAYLAIRRERAGEPDGHAILDRNIAKSFEAPVILEGNPEFRELLQWMHWGMVTAEELGIASENVEEMAENATDPVIRRFLGLDGDIGEQLGVSNDWMVHVIKAVGNYGEFYDRNLGAQSGLHVPRGMNALWRDGGALVAPSWQ